jgi:hypothetical protein
MFHAHPQLIHGLISGFQRELELEAERSYLQRVAARQDLPKPQIKQFKIREAERCTRTTPTSSRRSSTNAAASSFAQPGTPGSAVRSCGRGVTGAGSDTSNTLPATYI